MESSSSTDPVLVQDPRVDFFLGTENLLDSVESDFSQRLQLVDFSLDGTKGTVFVLFPPKSLRPAD